MTNENESDKLGFIAEIVKGALSTGLGAASVTEDVVKNIITDISKKESVSQLIDSAKSSKDDFVKSLRAEIGSYLKKIDLEKELDRILEKYDIKVNADISFKKKKTKKKS